MGFKKLMDKQYSANGFTYELKHKAVQRKTSRFGYTILFTNTQFPADFTLKTHREMDTVENAFFHVKLHLDHSFHVLGEKREQGCSSPLYDTPWRQS